MRSSILGLCLWASAVLASPSSKRAAGTTKLGPDADGKYTINGNGIRAQFIPYGASVSNLFIKSSSGEELDIVLGFDNATYYAKDKSHPHLGGVVGRYANRIRNSTFTVEGMTQHITPNDHPTKDHPKGVDTLHGGPNGYDWRQWTVVKQTANSITFSLVDKEYVFSPPCPYSFPSLPVTHGTYDFKKLNIC